MFRKSALSIALLLAAASPARAEEKYSLHEKLVANQVIPVQLNAIEHTKMTTTTGNQTTTVDVEEKRVLKAVQTVLAVKNGSPTEMRVLVDPDSYTLSKAAGAAEVKTANSVAGQTITIRRRADESVVNDFKDKINPSDLEDINGLLNPDQDIFPDDPIAVGSSWDVSAKLSKRADLGANDQLMAQCKLDWVKDIGGKKMGQITCNWATIRHEPDNVEADMEMTSSMLVDMSASQIVRCDQKGTVKYISPKDAAVQVNGTIEFNEQSEVPGAAGAATTMPSGPATAPGAP